MTSLALTGLALLVACSSAPAGAANTEPTFGINQAWESPEQADVAAAQWSRVLFWWSEMQKNGPGDLDLHATGQDGHLNNEIERGRELAGAILNTPPWVSQDGSPNGVPKNLYLPYDHPDNYWGQFTRRMAEHYRGRIDTWIIWNEVDIAQGPWSTWSGSTADYVQLLKVAYLSIKAENPRATVIPFGAAWWYDHGDTVKSMLDLVVADPDARRNNYYMDAANLHLYSRSGDIPRIVGWYEDQLMAHGMEKPVWISETNAIPYDDPVWRASKENFRATQDEQASYIVQAFATYLALGVERVSVNRMTDGTDFEAGGEPFGMLRNDGSARPALTSFQVVSKYFRNADGGEFLPPEPSGLTRAVLKKDDEEVITVLWTMQPSALDVTIPAIGAQALRVNKYGDASVIQSENGKYPLSLTGATANSNEADRRDFVIGGDPVILVERMDNDADSAYRSIL
jgi:hypothetical protein